MDSPQAILKLKDKKFDIEVGTGIGTLAMIAYSALERLGCNKTMNDYKDMDAIKEVCPFLIASTKVPKTEQV
jgi:hypothetical protein